LLVQWQIYTKTDAIPIDHCDTVHLKTKHHFLRLVVHLLYNKLYSRSANQ